MNGLLLVDKPSGPTSYDMIRWAKRSVRHMDPKPKIGHCGTLDPLASGLMIILLGKATKRQSEFMGQDKVYRGTMELGTKTDTGDITGMVIQERPVPVFDEAALAALANKICGVHFQTPPMYSALKLNGTPLYKLARKGETVERKPREITISEFEFLCRSGNDLAFRVRCSSGTYVRTLVEGIGEKLGTVATMTTLVREQIGIFSRASAVKGDVLKELPAGELNRLLTPLS